MDVVQNHPNKESVQVDAETEEERSNMGDNEEEMFTGTISVENPEWTSDLPKAKQKRQG